MNWIRLTLLVSGLLANSAPIFAKTVYLGSRASVLSLTYGEETLLRFPSAVKTVSKATRYQIQPANTEEPDYSVLSIKPRFSSGKSGVVFILDDGTLAKVTFVVKKSKPASSDGIYDFQKRGEVSGVDSQKPNPTVNEFDLLKAMIRGHRVAGYRVKRVEKEIKSKLAGLKLSLSVVYRGSDYAGYVYKLENVAQNKSFDIDIRKLAVGKPNLAIVSSVDRNKLTTKKNESETYLYVVANSSASFRRMALPVSVVEGKKKGAHK